MPARTPATAETTSTANNPCDLVNDHASLIDGCLIDAGIPANGTLRLTQSDGSTFDNTIPLFSDFVISGLVPTQQASPDFNEFEFSAGSAQINAQTVNVGSPLTATLAAGDVSNPRVDIVSLKTDGTLTVTAGTPSASPVQPTTPAGELLLLVAFVATGATGSTADGYTILSVNAPGGGQNNILAGTSSGQLAIWNQGSGFWQPESKVVFVRSLADLPAPSSNNIALVSGYTYVIVGAVDLGSNFLFCGSGNYAIVGLGGDGVSSITSSNGTYGPLLCNGSASVDVRDVQLLTSIANRYPLYLSDVSSFNATRASFAFDGLGTGAEVYISGTCGNLLFTSCLLLGLNNGFVPRPAASINSIVFDTCTYAQCADTFIFLDLTNSVTVNDRVRYSTCKFDVNVDQAALNLGLAATIPQSGVQINNCLFTGDSTYLAGINEQSETAYFRDNIGISQTRIGLVAICPTNATATTISASGTFVKAAIAAAATTGYFPCLFDVTEPNRFTYNGGTPRIFDLIFRGTLAPAGGSDSMSVQLRKNGSAIASAGVGTGSASASDPASITAFGAVELENGDYIEVWVANNDDTSNITVEQFTLKIKEA